MVVEDLIISRDAVDHQEEPKAGMAMNQEVDIVNHPDHIEIDGAQHPK